MTIHGWARPLIPVGLAALLLAACSAHGDSGPAGPGSTSSAALAARLTVAAHDRGSVHVHLERPKPFGLNGRLTIDGEVSFTAPESASFVIDLDSFQGRLIAIGDTWYLEGGDTGTDHKPWIRIDPRDPAHLPGDLFGEIAGLLVVPDVAGLTTYGAEVAYVPAAASGVPGTSQYVSHLTPEAWVAGAPPARQDELGTWADEEILSDFLTVLNIDADGLPVKQVFAAVPNSAEYTVEITYDHWGVPVHAVAPPADQVASTPGIVSA